MKKLTMKLAMREMTIWQQEFKKIELRCLGEKIDRLQTALTLQEQYLATAKKQYAQAVEKRGGHDAPYRGRNCDLEAIGLDIYIGKIREAMDDTKKELARLLRKEKRLAKS